MLTYYSSLRTNKVDTTHFNSIVSFMFKSCHMQYTTFKEAIKSPLVI